MELNRRIILPLQDDMICPSVVILCSESCILCLINCASLSLFHVCTAPFGRPSASFENHFCLSLFFVHPRIPFNYAYCFSLCYSRRHNTRRCSILILVLSYFDTYNLNGYMGCCGFREILIPCSTTALLSTTFLLISISRVEGEGEFI